MSNNTSKQILLSVIGVAILVIAVIGVSFAFFTYTRAGSKSNMLGAGTIDFKFTDGNTINLTNQFPISSEEGRSLTGENQVCTFTISGNISKGTINYVVKAISGDKINDRKSFRDSEIFAYITSPDVEGISFTPQGNFGTSGQALGSSDVVLGTGTLSSTTKKSRTFEVRMWIDDSVVSVGDNGTYTAEEFSNMYYSMKIKVEVQNNK